MKILIDADACPVTHIVIHLARERSIYSARIAKKGFFYRLYSGQFAMVEGEEASPL